MNRLLSTVLLTGSIAAAQGLDPASILKPLGGSWPTYSGDYSGKRYSTLTQLNQSNVKDLTLAWANRLASGAGGGRGGGQTIIGGEGTGDLAAGGGTNIKASILQVDGVLYVSAPDNAWA